MGLISKTGMNQGDLVQFLSNVLTLVNNLKTLANSLRSYVQDGMLTIATLLIDSAPEKFQITTTCAYRIAGIVYTKVATAALTFSGTSTINTAQAAGTGHWGVFLVQINAAGTVSTVHGTYTSGTDQDYATEALAIAALPAPAANNVQIGYITVQVKTGGNKWTEATDDLTPTSDCTTAHFYDLPAPATLPAAVSTAALSLTI